MELKIISQNENPLFDRREIVFEIDYFGEKTPLRQEIIGKIAAMVDANRELMVLNPLETKFGTCVLKGVVKIYNSADMLRKVEPKHRIEKYVVKKDKTEDSETKKE